jgi:hypothetical protein
LARTGACTACPPSRGVSSGARWIVTLLFTDGSARWQGGTRKRWHRREHASGRSLSVQAFHLVMDGSARWQDDKVARQHGAPRERA